MGFFSSLWNVAGGIVSNLASVALLGYASKLLSDNTNTSSTGETPIVDAGVRVQLNPSTDNQIPILYGEAYFGGNITDAQLSNDYKTMTYCLTLAEITGEKISTGTSSAYTFKGVYFNNNRVVFKSDGVTVDYTLDSAGNQDISMRDLVKVYFYKESTGIQPEGKSGTTPAPSSVMPGWTSGTHPMTGLIYAIVQVTYSRDKGISGLPDCTFHIKNSMTLPGDVLVDYMTNTRYGAAINPTELEGATFVALNSYASAGFTYTAISGSTTSSQIQINGLVDPNTVVLDNIEELAKAASSWITYDIHTGLWAVIINKAGTSIASFSDSNIIGDISISGTSLTQLNNVANIKYQNTDILDKTDFVKVSIPAGDLFQNEPQTTLERTLPFTTQQVVAMKIGLQELKQARVDKIITFSTDYSYLNLRAGDLIDVTSSVYGYTNKMFRVITVEETEDDNSSIILNFTCLEYDANVYAYNIQEYLVETDDGILGIGAIGKPDVPVVTKTEQANVPKIDIAADVPSGVVDAMEYWITFDTGIANDSARTYIHIGTYSNTNGTALTENDTVTYTYSGLSQSDFFVKVRGINSVATGPYSDPTGLIAYNPIVVADTVSNDPVVGLDGQLMGLGLLTLLNNLDKLFGGATGAGSLWDKIFSLFKNETGVDIVQEAKAGTLGSGGSGGGEVTSSTDVCEINGFIAAGTISITPKAATAPSCTSTTPWTITPSNYEYVIVSFLTKTGPTDGFYYVTYSLSNAGANVLANINYTISGITPSGFNGTYMCTSTGTTVISGTTYTTITIKYPSNPGTYASGAGSAKAVINTGTASMITPKSLLIKNNTSTNNSYTLSIQPSAGRITHGYNYVTTSDRYTYLPSNITGQIDGTGSSKSYIGTSSTPLVITGDYNSINQALQGKLYWTYLNPATGLDYNIPYPPANTTVTITYTLTVNGVSKSHVETLNYVDCSTLYPLRLV